MITEQINWTEAKPAPQLASAKLVLAFGSGSAITDRNIFSHVKSAYPAASIIFCSTSGEIYNATVLTDSLVTTAIKFNHTQTRCAKSEIENMCDSYAVGKRLATELSAQDLSHVLVFADGLKVNGSDLTRGLCETLPENVAVTGGLAGDKESFKNTYVGLNEQPAEGVVVAIGFYGDRLKVGYGSMGGWDPFGPERIVTKSEGSVLYELDGCSALDLYKKYLGHHAKDLPASALLFPLCVRTNEEHSLVRTVLSTDDNKNLMTFAGDLPEGSYARFMRANFDRLIEGASQSARNSIVPLAACQPDFALLVSCVGRRMVLKQRTEDEVDAVREIVGQKAAISGFYSYGEISPFEHGGDCELHNQTMTVTTFAEV
ncbi:hypothetical protein MNBD_NITROSPINAE01-387 [hydrothermal vent metagenome]|uniref:Uncharacterized protein n=1 Tax=hydrothermal vent metagenome TaxID=652676 RepID=A0A3B1BJ58_9ZZZZ